MICPICDNESNLIINKKSYKFRKDNFNIFEHFYKCEKCDNEFTNTTLDELNINQVYNQYRQKYNIPFPEQILTLRIKYDLSAIKMAEVLGFGVNQYGKYEKGEIPSVSNAFLLI